MALEDLLRDLSAEIGAAATIEVDRRGRMIAAAEPVRRGGGTGLVVRPAKRW